jgi:hypothetical protein
MKTVIAAVIALAACAAHAQTENQRRRVELDQTLNAFADRYATHIVAATTAIAQGNPSAEQRRLAHLLKLGTVSSMYDIASEPDPVARILDMVLVVTLQSYVWIDEDRAEQMFGSRGEILRRAIRQLRTDVWAMAARLGAPADQLQQLDAAILDWRRQNPDLELVAYTRVSDVAAARRDAGLDEIKRATGMFAEIAEAAKVADDARLLAERAFYAGKRMPFLLNWHAEALINETLAKPEIGQVLQATEALGKLPGQIAAEREALVAVLEDRNGRLSGLLGEVRKTTAATEGLAAQAVKVAETAERLSVNVRETTSTVERITSRPSAAAGGGQPPFDIEPYLKAAAEVNQTVAGLTRVLEQLDTMTAKRPWAPALKDTQSFLADQIDRLFWRALALMLAFFVLLLAYRWLAARLR